MANLISVLIVDDCEEDRDMFCRSLQQWPAPSFRVWEASSGAEAREIIEREHPDCLLLNHQISDIDCLESLSLIHQDYGRGGYPVLILTGCGDEAVASKTLKDSAVDYVVKEKISTEGTVRAITRGIEKSELMNTMQQQYLEIVRSHRELEQFAHRVSHDLQGPVRRVVTFLELLEKDMHGKLSESSQDYLNRCLKCANNMRQLVKDLLNYSLIGSHEVPCTAVNLNDVLQDVLCRLGKPIQDTRASVAVEALPTIKGRESSLQQMFHNLISNSLKFRGDEIPKVRVSAQDAGANWLINVGDNGVGIPGEYLERVFDVFLRVDNKGKTEGSGIGLAFCKKVVELHGGKIWVESVEGQGSSVSLTFPKLNEAELTQNAEGIHAEATFLAKCGPT